MDASAGADGSTRAAPSMVDEGALRGLQARRLDLRRQLAEVDEAIQGGVARGLARRIGDLERRLDRFMAGNLAKPCPAEGDGNAQRAAETPPSADTRVGDDSSLADKVARGFASLAARLDRIEEQLAGPAVQIDLGPPPEKSDPTPPFGDDLAWHGILFGQDLALDETIAEARTSLVADLLAGDPAAGAFAGQLLVFHSAPDAIKPQLLKELGESFYRWRPKATGEDQSMETALASWLEAACEAAGVRRKIELVRPGVRFNAAYHKSNDRGVEVAEVSGWVILREDGSVYQKASVGVR